MKFLYSIVLKAILILALFSQSLSASAERTTIAVASNFTSTMRELIKEFESQTEHEVRVSYGSSGRIYAQIRNGAPFDLFFSADKEKPSALVAEGLALASSQYTYATGQLVLWSKQTYLPLENAEVLKQDDFSKIALANPKLAPYGIAAQEVLIALGLENSTRRKWVLGENVTQAFQFVDSENASLGFMALSQLVLEESLKPGSVWIIPPELYNPIEQDLVFLQRGSTNKAAIDFLNFIQGGLAKSIIERSGYKVNR